ncbi:MAG: hypothetical protein HY288_16465 [Planctomycetia bacterium]|nr:hypothetical protein [Planctomycetia bacterium]
MAEPSKSQFVVESRIVEAEQNGLGHPKENEAILAPKITVFDGQSVNVGQTTQTPFVTAIKTAMPGTKPANTLLTEGLNVPPNPPFPGQIKAVSIGEERPALAPGGQGVDPVLERMNRVVQQITPQTAEPVITVVTEGLQINLQVTSVDSDTVSLDATIQTANILDVKERVVDEVGTTIQSPRVETVRVHATETVRLGEKTTLSCGSNSNRSVEFVIRRYSETDPPPKQVKSGVSLDAIKPTY